jgi:hypothetical protein
LAEDAEEPLDSLHQASPALVISVLAGKKREEMPDLSMGRAQEAPVGGDAHEDLGHGQGDDLSIGDPTTGISPSLWQKIIRRAINDGAEGVQVGVHRGLGQTAL